jgi:hypothetical protein
MLRVAPKTRIIMTGTKPGITGLPGDGDRYHPGLEQNAITNRKNKIRITPSCFLK